MQVVKLLEKEPENALQPNLVTSTSVTSSTHMTSASEETTVQQADDDGSGLKKTVTVQQETTQKVMTSTSEQVPKLVLNTGRLCEEFIHQIDCGCQNT